MKTNFHDIRLLAGFEVKPESVSDRILDREQTAQLAGALAEDLARAVPGVDQTVLVASGSLLEPAEMLRPGLPVWSAMADLAAPVVREQGTSSQILSVGAHQGRLPDRRLTAPQQPPQGRFIGIALMLAAAEETGPELAQRLEAELFDQGSIAPPARALLEQFSGAESVHGQLLTVNDLLALQHVQMDTAGLSGFWPVIEQVLLAPDDDAEFPLPADLRARWIADKQRLAIDFVIFDRFDQTPAHYPLWQRAFRTLTGLADAHGLKWKIEHDSDLTLDADQQVLTQNAGPTDSANGLTEQIDPAVGLIAWTIAENGQLHHVYPLSQTAVAQTGRRLAAEHSLRKPAESGLVHAGDPARLQPA